MLRQQLPMLHHQLLRHVPRSLHLSGCHRGLPLIGGGAHCCCRDWNQEQEENEGIYLVFFVSHIPINGLMN